MASVAANPTADNLKGPFSLSVAFHILLFSGLFISTVFSHRGESWGGAGGSINVGLVGSAPGVPLPRPEIVTTSRVVDESKGLYKAEPQPVTPPPIDSTPIPKFDRNKPPQYVSRPSRVLEDNTPPPAGAIPYGQGGTPTVPYTSVSLGSGALQGGIGVNGAGGGNFGSHFPWYVEAVGNRISSNWLQSTVDPTIHFAPRVICQFQILRNGTITNIQITQSSGNKSVDYSAVRAVQMSNPLNPLPAEYSGSFVNVEFWFDFHR
ncbi:MAG: TonB family protein [Candidatus Acidiferrales bacterium]